MRPVFKDFEKRAEASPDAVALRYRHQEMSYSVLNAKANQLARQLVSMGVGRATPVAVLVEPGFEIAIALLAILKTGGVYVPIDPSYPQTRLHAVLEQVSPPVVLTVSKLADRLFPFETSVFYLDKTGEQLDALPAHNPDVLVDAEDTAYIYFTSGTTGAPKGVMASHANLCNYLHSARDRYRFGADDIMPSVARYTFSISMFELMLPLVSGGTLLLLDREEVLDPPRMLEVFEAVTFFHIGPSLLRNLVAFVRKALGDDFSALAHVRHASSGGDMVPPELLEDLREVFPNAEVYVIYGCSEVSCMGCTYRAPQKGNITRTYVGQPFPGVGLRLVDEQRREVLTGDVGEICFSGEGVVKGYLNQPDLTAEKFVSLDGQRFYTTGDLGRLDQTGDLEMLGRRDFQVQLRGMRVELPEIELSLRRAPGVKDAVVSVREMTPGDKTLVAYVVFAQHAVKHMASVRQYLTECLPDYMVPGRYVELEALPLNHNMKVDRFALPDPGTVVDVDRAATVRPPETDNEQALARIWQRLLQTDDIGLDDNFFDLGGYSLLAMEAILQVENELKVTLDGMDVLRENLEVLAGLCDQQLGIQPAKTPSAPSPQEQTLASEAFYFGPEQQLYGRYFPVPGGKPKTAALICPPIGPEWTRSHFVIRKVIRKLVAQGIPVMRFDFYGTADSLGQTSDATLDLWKDNIACAARELKTRSSAMDLLGVGVRLGGSLLAESAAESDLGFAKTVLWDPVASGSEHLASTRAAHQRLVKAHRAMRPLFYRNRKTKGEEILSVVYSKRAIAQLSRVDLLRSLSETSVPISILASTGAPDKRRALERACAKRSSCHLVWAESAADWQDVSALEDIQPDTGLSRSLISLAGF